MNNGKCWLLGCINQFSIVLSNAMILMKVEASWCSVCHYCTLSFIKAWTQVLRKFKFCPRRVGGLRWWVPHGLTLPQSLFIITIITVGDKLKFSYSETVYQRSFLLPAQYFPDGRLQFQLHLKLTYPIRLITFR